MHRKGSATPLSHLKSTSSSMIDPPKVYEPFTDSRISIPVHIKSYDREERVVPLTIDISLRTLNSSHHQTLVVEITEETDPCFLYVMECGETEFHVLKEEQGVIIDFLIFPHMLENLLRNCDGHGSMYAQITKAQSEATLNVIEINNFKQLLHISLKLRQGQNETLMRHLSKNLTKMKDENAELNHRLSDLESSLEDERRTTLMVKEQYAILAAEKDKAESQAMAELKSKVNDVKEQMMEQNLRQARLHEDEKRGLTEKYEGEIARTSARLEEVTSKYSKIAEAKSSVEIQYSDLTKNHRQLQHELELAMSQLEPLRAGNLKLTSTQTSQERNLTELSLKVQNYEQQLKDKEGIIEKLNELTATLNEQKAQREEEIVILRTSKQKLEDKIAQSVQEINKGNQIIEKLQTARKAKREKLKLKSAVMLQQEEVINKKQSIIDECEREKYGMQREIALRDDRIREGEKTADDLRRQLDDAHRLLEESKHQISYLNKEMTKTRTITPSYSGSSYAPSSSKPPTPSPYGTTFKPSGYNIEALRATPTRSQLSPSGSVTAISEMEPAPRLKDPVKYKEPLA